MMSIGTMPSMPPPTSPRDQIVSKLDEQVETGEITSEDQDAMLDALDAIHAERMEAGAPDFSSGPPSKEEMQANFETLLADQVEAGTLDQEQADQLAEMFESGELGHHAEAGPPPPPGGAQQGSDAMEELMASLLETLQSDSGYDGSGEQSSSGVASILADFKV